MEGRMGLCAHVDTKRVEEEMVMNVPDVPRTATWNPIPHRIVISTILESLDHVTTPPPKGGGF
jgi:hypothetical protein